MKCLGSRIYEINDIIFIALDEPCAKQAFLRAFTNVNVFSNTSLSSFKAYKFIQC
jgi:hypothetical protein